jgi:hypothetical protein
MFEVADDLLSGTWQSGPAFTTLTVADNHDGTETVTVTDNATVPSPATRPLWGLTASHLSPNIGNEMSICRQVTEPAPGAWGQAAWGCGSEWPFRTTLSLHEQSPTGTSQQNPHKSLRAGLKNPVHCRSRRKEAQISAITGRSSLNQSLLTSAISKQALSLPALSLYQ